VIAAALRIFLTAVTVFLVAYYLVVSYFAFRRINHQECSGSIPDRCSVIIPAYNEEGVIGDLLQDLRNSSSPITETIVIDDHSSDSTWKVAERMNLTVIRNETRLGKAASLNKGSAIAKEDIIVVFDADNRPEKDCIKHLLKRFDSENVAIVTGVTKVRSNGLVSKLAALEFSVCFYWFHPFSSRFDFFPILHGAFFAVRRELASFAGDALTEDFDTSVSLASRGYRMEFEPEAISCVSAAPSFSLFKKQRERWIRGSVQASLRHKGFSKRVFRHIGFLGLFFVALGYSLPLVWAATLTFVFISYCLREYLLMHVGILATSVYTAIALLANRRAGNKMTDALTLPLLGCFYFSFVIWYFVKAVVLEYLGVKAEFDKIPHTAHTF